MKKFITLLLLTFPGIYGVSQSCLLDPSFAIGGKAIGYTNSENRPYSANIVIQPDGKIIQAGSVFSNTTFNDFAVIRYNGNGSLDSTFGSNGLVITSFGLYTNDYVGGVTLQADGKIVVAGNSYDQGNSDFAVVRYKNNGSLDTSFGVNGKITTAVGPDQDYAHSVTLQPDGKIIVAGSGSRLDSILCSYSSFYVPVSAVVRYNSTGNLDSTFGQNGKIVFPTGSGYDLANAVTFQPNGKILLAGTSYYNCGCGYYGGVDCYSVFLALTRLNSNGSVDTSFGKSGRATDSALLKYPSAILLQGDGKIVVTGTGSLNGFIAERYNNNGRLDSSFGTNGKVFTTIGQDINDYSWSNSIAIQPNGRIVLAGGFSGNGGSSGNDFVVVRYRADGSLDSTFNRNGIAVFHLGSSGTYDVATGVALQGSRIIAGGYSHANYDPSGSMEVIRLLDSANTIPIVITAAGPITFCQGGSVILTASPTGNFQWYKDGAPISGAINATYTAVSSGYYSATVNNSNGCGTSASIVITVNNNPPKPTINWDGVVFSTPIGYAHYQWYLNNTIIASASNSVYQPKSFGWHKVLVTDNGNCSNISDSLPFVVTGVTDIMVGEATLRYYPNPAQNLLYVDIANILNGKFLAELYDLTGRIVQKQALNHAHNQLSLQRLPAGVYQLTIHNGREKANVKVIIVK